MKKSEYFENLDGLRFICFLSVFFYHSFHTNSETVKNSPIYSFIKNDIFGNGNLGVNFFFVLSGFLITFLLIQEKKDKGKINIKNFFIRRSLRIWPLFYLCVAFGFLIFPALKTLLGQIPNETANPFYYISFLNNFDNINNGQPDSSILAVLWSVAIEEQFYLIWPFILLIFPTKRYWVPFSSIIVLSLIFRFFNNNDIIYEIHTLSCIGDMAVGAFGAWVILENNKVKIKFQKLNKVYIFLIYALVLMVYLFRIELLQQNFLLKIAERIIIAVIFLLVILEQNYSHNSFFKLANYRLITQFGKMSYGFYCLHFIGILISVTLTNKLIYTPNLWQVIFLDTIIALVLTLILGKISYRFIESPFLKMKNNFRF